MDCDGLVLNPPDDHDALVLGRLHVQGDDDLLLPRALLVSVCVGVLVLVLVCGAGASPVTVLMVKRGCRHRVWLYCCSRNCSVRDVHLAISCVLHGGAT